MIEIVNGYPCFNCTDVANAKKGIDPAHPNSDPTQAASGLPGGSAFASSRGAAVTYGGNLVAPNNAQPSAGDSTSHGAPRVNRAGMALDITA